MNDHSDVMTKMRSKVCIFTTKLILQQHLILLISFDGVCQQLKFAVDVNSHYKDNSNVGQHFFFMQTHLISGHF